MGQIFSKARVMKIFIEINSDIIITYLCISVYLLHDYIYEPPGIVG